MKNRGFLSTIGIIIIAGIVLIVLASGIAYFIAVNVAGTDDPEMENGEDIINFTGVTFPLGEFTTNLAGNGSRNIFQVEIMLELDESGVEDELENREPQIRDQIYTILRSKTAEDLNDQEGMEELRLEIKEAVNERISEGEVVSVYFNQPLIT